MPEEITYSTQGNGAFLTIIFPDKRSVFLQGDDAIYLGEELDKCTTDKQVQLLLSQYDFDNLWIDTAEMSLGGEVLVGLRWHSEVGAFDLELPPHVINSQSQSVLQDHFNKTRVRIKGSSSLHA